MKDKNCENMSSQIILQKVNLSPCEPTTELGAFMSVAPFILHFTEEHFYTN